MQTPSAVHLPPNAPPIRAMFRPNPPPTVGCKTVLRPAQARVKRDLARVGYAR